MANPALGSKQVCPNCQAKFYDLARRPAVCPKCSTAFDPEEAVRNRRIRARTSTSDYEDAEEAPVKAADPEAEGFEDEPDQTPEIDDEAAAEPIETDDEADGDAAPAGGAAEDLGVDFAEEGDLDEEESDDVPFLEEEDEDFDGEDIEGLADAGDEDDR